MPLKISDFTSQMQTLLQRGEVDICVQHDGEVFAQMNRGTPVDFLYWQERKPIHPQIMTVSQGSSDDQKQLAYAYINRACSPEIQERYAAELTSTPRTGMRLSPKTWPARVSPTTRLAWKACGIRTGTGISKTSRRSSKPSTRSSV